jgi:hypothetical protein
MGIARGGAHAGEHGAAVYFEAAASTTALVLLGRWLEARARGRATDALTRLLHRAPATAETYRLIGPERLDPRQRDAQWLAPTPPPDAQFQLAIGDALDASAEESAVEQREGVRTHGGGEDKGEKGEWAHPSPQTNNRTQGCQP